MCKVITGIVEVYKEITVLLNTGDYSGGPITGEPRKYSINKELSRPD
jgi:hypothetical protein